MNLYLFEVFASDEKSHSCGDHNGGQLLHSALISLWPQKILICYTGWLKAFLGVMVYWTLLTLLFRPVAMIQWVWRPWAGCKATLAPWPFINKAELFLVLSHLLPWSIVTTVHLAGHMQDSLPLSIVRMPPWSLWSVLRLHRLKLRDLESLTHGSRSSSQPLFFSVPSLSLL